MPITWCTSGDTLLVMQDQSASLQNAIMVLHACDRLQVKSHLQSMLMPAQQPLGHPHMRSLQQACRLSAKPSNWVLRTSLPWQMPSSCNQSLTPRQDRAVIGRHARLQRAEARSQIRRCSGLTCASCGFQRHRGTSQLHSASAAVPHVGAPAVSMPLPGAYSRCTSLRNSFSHVVCVSASSC